jgi:hypothetical protein
MAAASTDGHGSAPGWPESVAQFKETSARIDRIVGELPFKQRVAFTMRKMRARYDAIGKRSPARRKARGRVFQALRRSPRAG